MKTVGIIVEYNPLHYGHVYHFQQSKKETKADAVVAVMSGNFLQRGEPAIVNKWARAEMALHMGADLVIELPVAFSSQPAEWFAFGAVSALHATGIVDSLCFGSESGELSWLKELARHLSKESPDFQELIKAELKKGMNYPAAYSATVEKYSSTHMSPLQDHQLDKPNNILGLHYLIALERLNSSIQAYTVTRQKAGYHQQDVTDQQIASATAIRRILLEQKDLAAAQSYVPDFTYQILAKEWKAGRSPITWEDFSQPLLVQLLNQSEEQLAAIFEVSEGLEYRVKQTLPTLSSPFMVDQLLNALKTKRYTRTKLQRTLLRILLRHLKSDLSLETLKQGVPYLRVLGFTDTGRKLLKQMKKTASVPVISKVTTVDSPLLDLDIRASSIYSLAYGEPSGRDMFQEYYQAPIYVPSKQ